MAAQVCPVCNCTIDSGDHTCKRCGFKLAGQTKVFKPVDPHLDAGAGAAHAGLEGRFALYVAEGPQAGEEIELDGHRLTLGRDPHCDIFLNDMTVSREHAVITVDGEDVTVLDDNSLNGTWVDGKVVESAKLEDGSRLQIGTFTLVLVRHGA